MFGIRATDQSFRLNSSSSGLSAFPNSTSDFRSQHSRSTFRSTPARSLNSVSSGGITSWITQKIRDRKLRTTAASAASDGAIDRTDMIGIFRSATDGKQIDRTEFQDLQKIVRNGTSLGMPDYVQNLSKKVVFGNYANREYAGRKLGNLRPDSTAGQLNKLVNKWFFGSDRPSTNDSDGSGKYRYQYLAAPLFEGTPSYSDVAQGDTGDCYFLASLAATALQSPQQIQSMFTDNGDGTYTVRFYQDNGAADYVTVDRYLPPSAANSLDRAFAVNSNALWVGLAEKAYAQWNETGSAKTYWDDSNNLNSYQGISGGVPSRATEQITGRQTTFALMKNSTPDQLVNAFNAGQLVTLGSSNQVGAVGVESGHAYVMVGYDSATQTFTLYNPWGVDDLDSNGNSIGQDDNPNDGKVQLSWAELSSNFNSWFFAL